MCCAIAVWRLLLVSVFGFERVCIQIYVIWVDVRVALIVTYQPLTHFTKNTQKYNLLTLLLLLLLFSRSVGLLVGSLREPENLNWAPHSTNFGFIFFSVWWKKQQRKYMKKLNAKQKPTKLISFRNSFGWFSHRHTHKWK